jgi:hypothetical protein
MRSRVIVFSLFICATFGGISAVAQTFSIDSITDAQADALIDKIENLPVTKLDPGLPYVPFAKWLGVQAGEGAKIGWALRYASDPADEEDADFPPPAVEADAVTADGRSITIFIAVGSHNTFGNIKPYVYRIDEGRMASLIPAGEDKRPFSVNLQRLRDIPLALCMEEDAKILEADE